jgi:tetratricopeptide (TPR) repeat protein
MSPDLGSARLTTALALAFGLCLVAPSLVRADGGGGGSNSPNAPTCGKGEYWSDRTRNCEKLRAGLLTDGELARYAVLLARSKRYDEAMDAFNLMRNPGDAVTLLPDADLAEYAIVLAKAERYNDALAVLDKVKNPNTAVALNYRGYVTRHLGRLDEGIGYYLKSVALEPHYAQVREYLGEAYVIKGDMAKAQEQLAVIETLCGTKCEEYEDLAEAIEKKS